MVFVSFSNLRKFILSNNKLKNINNGLFFNFVWL